MGVQGSCCRKNLPFEQEADNNTDLQRGAADASKIDIQVSSSKNSSAKVPSPGRKVPKKFDEPNLETYSKGLKTDERKTNLKETERKIEILPELEEKYKVKIKEEKQEPLVETKPKIALPPKTIPLKNLPPITNFRVKEMISKLKDLKFSDKVEMKYQSPLHLRKLGPLLLPSGEVYIGYWKQNVIEGMGVKVFPDGSIFRGEFVSGKYEGQGILINVDGHVYKGEWKSGLPHGIGEYLEYNGSFYYGEWKEGKRDGKGSEIWPDGTNYEGEYCKGLMQGSGTLVWPNGCSYTGNFEGSKLEGKGTYKWEDEKEYHGDWKFSKMNGTGIMTWKDGRRYEGHWEGGKRNGKGTYLQPINTEGGKKLREDNEILTFEGTFGNNHFKGKLIKGKTEKMLEWDKGNFKALTQKELNDLENMGKTRK